MNLSDIEGLDDIREESYFSHRFFEGLDDLDVMGFDNYVVDVSVVYSVAVGREYFSDLFSDSDTAKDAWSRLGDGRFERKSKGGKDVLEFSSTPSSRVEALEELSEQAELYVPDITEECIRASPRQMIDREKVLEAFEQNSSYLGVKDVMGIETYSREGLEVTGKRNEDKALVEAAGELDGDTCILTYDEDFLSEDVYATVPEIAQDLE